MVANPVFLVGAERSGSTLLRLMLDSHPEVSFFEEFEYAVQQFGSDGPPELDAYYEFLAHDRVYQLSRFSIDRDLKYEALVDSFLEQATEGDAAVRGATVHFGFDRVLSIWPDARFIHLIRDPRDVAPSVIEMSWAGNVYQALDKWLDAEDTWSRIAPELGADRWVEVHFEDLIADHVGVLRRICAFLGVDYTDEMLSYADDTDYGIPDPSRVSAWRDKLTDREVRLVEARVGDLLEARDYQPSGLPALHIDRRQELLIKADSKLRRPRQRAAKIGWMLVLAETITKALRWDAGYRAVRKRSHARINDNRRRSWRA